MQSGEKEDGKGIFLKETGKDQDYGQRDNTNDI